MMNLKKKLVPAVVGAGAALPVSLYLQKVLILLQHYLVLNLP